MGVSRLRQNKRPAIHDSGCQILSHLYHPVQDVTPLLIASRSLSAWYRTIRSQVVKTNRNVPWSDQSAGKEEDKVGRLSVD